MTLAAATRTTATRAVRAVRAVPAMLRRPMLREYWWLAAGSQGATVLSQITTLLLVRTVTRVEVGQVVFAQSVAVLAFLVLDPRFEDAVQRYVPLLRKESEARSRALFWRLLRWDLGLGVATTVAAALAWFTGVLPSTDLCRPGYLALAFSAIGVGSMIGTLHAGFAVSGGLPALGRRTIVASVATATVTAVFVLNFGAGGYLAATVVAAAIQVALLLPYCLRHLSLRAVTTRPRLVDRTLPAGFVRFVVTSSLGTSLSVGSDSGMLAMVGLSGGPDLVAVIRVAGAPGRMLMSALSPIATQVFPRLSRFAAEGDLAGIRRMTRKASLVVLVPVIPAILTSLVLMGPALELLYGQRYRQAAPVAVLFVVASCLRCLVLWAKVLPLAAGRPGLRVRVVAVESALMLLLAFLVPKVLDGVPAVSAGIGAGVVVLTAGLASFWTWTSRREDLLQPRRTRQPDMSRADVKS